MIAAAVAVLAAIFSILTAVFTKKRKKQVLVYGVAGLIIGMLIGYLAAPLVISFL
jgi:hypothetical protein